MSGVAWFDDRPLDAADARVPIDDASVMLGDGVFESIAIGPRGPFAVTRHIRRLRSAAERIGIDARRHARARCERGGIAGWKYHRMPLLAVECRLRNNIAGTRCADQLANGSRFDPGHVSQRNHQRFRLRKVFRYGGCKRCQAMPHTER